MLQLWAGSGFRPIIIPHIAPDSISTTTVTAIVYDEEGRRLPNQPVTWSIDIGTIVNSDLVTDNVGEARATVRSSANHETGTVWAESGSVGGGSYVEYANEGDPYIIITSPTGGNVSGFVEVDATAYGNDTSDPLENVALYIDGAEKGGITASTGRASGIETERLSNGLHTLRAYAVDGDGNTMWSQTVIINVYNSICNLQPGKMEIFTDDAIPGNASLSAQMCEVGTWTVQVTDRNNTAVYSTSGTGPGQISASWDGKVSGAYSSGIYEATITTTGQHAATKTQEITISAAETRVLICGIFRDEKEWCRKASMDEMTAVADACKERGLTYTLLANPIWARNLLLNQNYPYDVDLDQGSPLRLGIQGWLKKDYRYFFYTSHGEVMPQPTTHTEIMFYAPLGGHRYVRGDNYYYDPVHRITRPAFSDIGINGNQYRIVQFNACHSGGNSVRPDVMNPFKLLPIYNETAIPNAFGNYNDIENDQTYIGWTHYYFPNTVGARGTVWTQYFWSFLGDGYSVDQAENLAHYRYSGWMDSYLYTYGGPSVTWLTY